MNFDSPCGSNAASFFPYITEDTFLIREIVSHEKLKNFLLLVSYACEANASSTHHE